MPQEQCQQAILKSKLSDPTAYFGRDLIEALPAGRNRQLMRQVRHGVTVADSPRARRTVNPSFRRSDPSAKPTRAPRCGRLTTILSCKYRLPGSPNIRASWVGCGRTIKLWSDRRSKVLTLWMSRRSGTSNKWRVTGVSQSPRPCGGLSAPRP